MILRALWVPPGLMVLLACGSSSSFTVANTDSEALKNSPAGVSTFGLLDILLPVTGLLGGSQPACITSTVDGTTRSLTLAGCRSATGGTLAGTASVDLSGAPANLVETFNGLVSSRSATLQWTYTGRLDLAKSGAAVTLTPEPGFTLTVADAAQPANDKAWTFTGALTAITGTPGRFTLQGNYSFGSGTTDKIDVAISAANPLVWAQGQTYPVSGQMAITDGRADQEDPETVTVVFNNDTVTLNGGKITLPS